jgi:hypothetical protein
LVEPVGFVLIAESPEELQELLNISNAFANKWNLKLNPKKSKMLLTGKKLTRKVPENYEMNQLKKRASTNIWVISLIDPYCYFLACLLNPSLKLKKG